MTTLQKGYYGEDLACKYLIARGYSILQRNWRCYYGEIDLIAVKDILTFFEVKTVFNSVISAAELFTSRKRHHLVRAISIYINQNNVPAYGWSMDLICIDMTRKVIDHYPNLAGY